MAYKSTGTAGKSASGAAMSRYDVEVEGRLKELEKAVAELKTHSHDSSSGGGDCSGVEEKLDKIIAKLKAAGYPYIDR